VTGLGRTYRLRIATLYDRLGVDPHADQEEIRAAYRRMARRYHPDGGSSPSAVQMAAINEAWEVLGDSARRASYDASLVAVARAAARPAPQVVHEPPPDDDDVDLGEVRHARWAIPLPWLLVLGTLVVIFVFTAYAASRDRGTDAPHGSAPAGERVDGIITVNSCIRLDDVARAFEVSCGGPHLGVVRAIVNAAAPCPLRTEGFFDRAGSELVCITRD
jgi:hypothetical protein